MRSLRCYLLLGLYAVSFRRMCTYHHHRRHCRVAVGGGDVHLSDNGQIVYGSEYTWQKDGQLFSSTGF